MYKTYYPENEKRRAQLDEQKLDGGKITKWIRQK
jgi:hypothetical protein